MDNSTAMHRPTQLLQLNCLGLARATLPHFPTRTGTDPCEMGFAKLLVVTAPSNNSFILFACVYGPADRPLNIITHGPLCL